MPKHIYYFCNNRHTYALGIFAAHCAKHIGTAIRIIPYNLLPGIPAFGGGAFIFTDLDRMTEQQRERGSVLADRLRSSGRTILNHPSKTLRRFDLLRALKCGGINDFDTYRIEQWQEIKRFPVFIRHVDHCRKPLTSLLADEHALRNAVNRLPGIRPGEPERIIVEFGNAPTPDGRFVKYAAFRVGDIDYASSREVADNWWINYPDAATEQDLEDQRQYARCNPHRQQLREVWRIAQADYGRVDYCVVDGRVQVFEINTNPTIVHLPDKKIDQGIYSEPHETALHALLANVEEEEPVPNPLFVPGGTVIDVNQAHQQIQSWGLRNWSRNWDGFLQRAAAG